MRASICLERFMFPPSNLIVHVLCYKEESGINLLIFTDLNLICEVAINSNAQNAQTLFADPNLAQSKLTRKGETI